VRESARSHEVPQGASFFCLEKSLASLTPESIPGSRLPLVRETNSSAGHRSGEIARRAGVSPDTLRHYERKGLLAKPRRLENGYRMYPPEALDRVRLVQHALAVGFTLDELARLLRARERGQPPCREVRALAEQKLRDVERQLEDLARFREALDRMLRDWDSRLAKANGRSPAWLLESLASKPPVRSAARRALVIGRREKRKEHA
jgi:MerR family transcriptional regulator, mercuric resistance operon regulatory protein